MAESAGDRVPAVPQTGEDRIAAAFALRSGRAALMPYVMGGYPDIETSLAIGEAYAANGADLVELGVPYSDPLADGPVIHAAGTAALQAGATLDGVLEVGQALARRVPVVLMCYVNLVLTRGAERFAQRLRDAGISGLIVPDLPLHEAGDVRAACDAAGVALVPLVAPTTSDERLTEIAAQARGFVYVVSVVGTTGERPALGDHVTGLLARVKQRAELPVALGFGISTPEQAAAAAAAGADGVIVASRLIRAVSQAEDPAALAGEVVAQLAAALIR
ncbi:MAG: tryptophan synthase subunit alpha [Actinomycetota bacterium]|nr:tryptophan synthase subunit alpha [Actinomycetota bacterium]MDP8967333.1 tryptophan synthase subunit alpha [Actinomycetota bacterium]